MVFPLQMPPPRSVCVFEVNPTRNETAYDLCLIYYMMGRVTSWHLEYTLCTLRQYLEVHVLRANAPFRGQVLERQTMVGVQTEFCISTNYYCWSKSCDEEVMNILTMFIPVSRPEISLQARHVPASALSRLVRHVEEIEIEVEVPESPPTHCSQLAVPNPSNTLLIEALIASWAEIPDDDDRRSCSPLSDGWADADDDDEDEDEDEGTEPSSPPPPMFSSASQVTSSLGLSFKPSTASSPSSFNSSSPLFTPLSGMTNHATPPSYLPQLWPEQWSDTLPDLSSPSTSESPSLSSFDLETHNMSIKWQGQRSYGARIARPSVDACLTGFCQYGSKCACGQLSAGLEVAII